MLTYGMTAHSPSGISSEMVEMLPPGGGGGARGTSPPPPSRDGPPSPPPLSGEDVRVRLNATKIMIRQRAEAMRAGTPERRSGQPSNLLARPIAVVARPASPGAAAELESEPLTEPESEPSADVAPARNLLTGMQGKRGLGLFKAAGRSVIKDVKRDSITKVLSNNGSPRTDTQLAARKRNNTITNLEAQVRESVTWQHYKAAAKIQKVLATWQAYDLADSKTIRLLADQYRQDQVDAAATSATNEQRRELRKGKEEEKRQLRKLRDAELEQTEGELTRAIADNKYEEAHWLSKRLGVLRSTPLERTRGCCSKLWYGAEEEEEEDGVVETDDEEDEALLKKAAELGPPKKPVEELFQQDELDAYRECFNHVDTYHFGKISRRRDCHSADAPSPCLLKHLLQGEGGAAE